jgi:lysophospholipase L1-like esterase
MASLIPAGFKRSAHAGSNARLQAGRARARWESAHLSIELLEERCLLSTLTNPAAVPMPGFTSYWYWRIAQFASAPKGDPEVVFLGDSITDAFAGSAGAPVWDARIAPLNAADFAIGGSTTQNVLWQIDHGQLDGISPRVVVVMIGTNNFGLLGESPELIAGGIDTLVADVQAHQPQAQVLLLGILPRGTSPADPFRGGIAATNRMISQLGAARNVTYLDIGGAFLQPDGSISGQVMPDYLHPSTLGYEIYATSILPSLHALLGPPAVPSTPPALRLPSSDPVPRPTVIQRAHNDLPLATAGSILPTGEAPRERAAFTSGDAAVGGMSVTSQAQPQQQAATDRLFASIDDGHYFLASAGLPATGFDDSILQPAAEFVQVDPGSSGHTQLAQPDAPG